MRSAADSRTQFSRADREERRGRRPVVAALDAPLDGPVAGSPRAGASAPCLLSVSRPTVVLTAFHKEKGVVSGQHRLAHKLPIHLDLTLDDLGHEEHEGLWGSVVHWADTGKPPDLDLALARKCHRFETDPAAPPSIWTPFPASRSWTWTWPPPWPSRGRRRGPRHTGSTRRSPPRTARRRGHRHHGSAPVGRRTGQVLDLAP